MRLLLLVSFALTLGGCAGLGTGSGRVAIGSISNLPQVHLPGATMAEARSVAMAAARTKGWEITAADANRLLLERPLPPDLPQAQALNSPLAPPRMQVETDIVERRDGAIVALRAFILTNPGTKDEKRLDYTSDYESQLLISLSSLSSAWLAARDKVRSEVPTLAAYQGEQETEADVGGSLGDVAETVSPSGAAPVGGQAVDPSARAGTAEAAAPSSPDPMRIEPAPIPPPTTRIVEHRPPPASGAAAPLSAPVIASTPPVGTAPVRSTQVASGALLAPTIEAPASPTTAAEAAPSVLRPGPSLDGGVPSPAPVAPTVPVETAASNDMLVLSQDARKGLWAYYAEDYARLRGCAIGDRGAMLLQQSDGFELHEVECDGAANVLVRCRGGVCEPLR